MDHDHTHHLLTDLAEARKKKKTRHDSPKTPPGSPSHQPPPPLPLVGPSGTSRTSRASGSSQLPPPPPSPSTHQSDPSTSTATPSFSKVHSSSDEDIGHDHIPTVNLKQNWWKPLTKDIPATAEPAWYNVSKPLLLGGLPGQVTIQSDFFFNKDLEYLRYGRKSGRPLLLILKMKAAYYPDVGLEQMVPDQMWIEEEYKYDIAAMYGHLNHLPPTDKKILTTAVNLWTRNLDATGFEFKHDFTIIDSPRAVTFRDKYGVQMIMRFNEIHKFSDGTLQQIDEALDYRVKEFKVNRMNTGLNTQF
ncbi:hypothetical protein Tco_0575057 [Tanacetum coccineum]